MYDSKLSYSKFNFHARLVGDTKANQKQPTEFHVHILAQNLGHGAPSS